MIWLTSLNAALFSASSGQNSSLDDVELSLSYSAHIDLTIRYDYKCNTAPTVTILIWAEVQ